MRACSHIAECSLAYAKIMQTSAMRTCSQIAECSLAYAKIMLFIEGSKQGDKILFKVYLLVGVFHKPLIFLVQPRHHTPVSLIHRGLDILHSPTLGIDRLVDGELQRMPSQPMPVAHAGHHVKRTVDGQRANRQLEFISKHERPPTEHSHVACEGARAFGKHHQRHAFLKHLARLVVGLADLARPALVDKDVVSRLTRPPYEGNFAQSLLHHPLEVASQKSVDNEDVDRSLVVADKDVALMLAQMLPPFYLYGEQADPDEKPGPPFARVIAPEMAVAHGASYRRDKGTEDRAEDENGQENEELINSIQEFHVVCVEILSYYHPPTPCPQVRIVRLYRCRPVLSVMTVISLGIFKRNGTSPPNPTLT